MCLGIPGQIVSITDTDKKLAMADVSGVGREVNVACILRDGEKIDDLIGCWTLIHVGFAMSRINEEEAAETLKILTELGDVQEELAAMRASQQALAQN